MSSSVHEAVRKAACRLGFSALTRHQEEVVISFMKGNDVFVSLPTGSGKTVYCILPFAFDILLNEQSCIVIVVSPLLALMRDQVSLVTNNFMYEYFKFM